MNQQIKTHMSKKKFRIGELARELQVKKFVIRFWEKEFELKSDRSQGGQRYYTNEDFEAFNTIKHLLYQQGFTIAGAKIQLDKMLKQNNVDIIQEPIAQKPVVKKTQNLVGATQAEEKQAQGYPVPYIPKDFFEKLSIFKQKLISIKETLK